MNINRILDSRILKFYQIKSAIAKIANYLLLRIWYRKPAALRWWAEASLKTLSTDHNLLVFWTTVSIGSMFHIFHEVNLLNNVYPHLTGASAIISIVLTDVFIVTPPAMIMAEITSQIPGYMGLYDFCNVHFFETAGYLSAWMVLMICVFGSSTTGYWFASTYETHMGNTPSFFLWIFTLFLIFTCLAGSAKVLRVVIPCFLILKAFYLLFIGTSQRPIYWYFTNKTYINGTLPNLFFPQNPVSIFKALPYMVQLYDGFILSFLHGYYFHDPRRYATVLIGIVHLCTLFHCISLLIYSLAMPHYSGLEYTVKKGAMLLQEIGEQPTLIPYWYCVLIMATFVSGGTKISASSEMQYVMSKDYLHLLSIAYTEPNLIRARVITAILAIFVGILYPMERLSVIHRNFISVYCIWMACVFLITRSGASHVKYSSTWGPVKLWTWKSGLVSMLILPKAIITATVFLLVGASIVIALCVRMILQDDMDGFLTLYMLLGCATVCCVILLFLCLMPIYKPRRSYRVKLGNVMPFWVILIHTLLICSGEENELLHILIWMIIGLIAYVFIGVRTHYVYDSRWLYQPSYFEPVAPSRDHYFLERGKMILERLKKVYNIDV